jgi:4-hydroxybenzoate polyprenyltransferase
MPHKNLCVDCDGTLITTDLLVEGIVRSVMRNPLRLFSILWWLFQGRQTLKDRVAEMAPIDPAKLPYREEFLIHLRQRRDAGWRLFLVTAADERYAHGVSSHLGLFEGVFASNKTRNLKGSAKQELLVQTFGRGGYDYAGDADCDFAVWSSADVAIPVGRDAAFAKKIKRVNPNVEPFCEKKTDPKRWLDLIRLHQWAKNLIIFVPLVTSHQIFNTKHLLHALAAFLSLSLIASATYILNDLFDLDNDRAHKTKRNRPLACGGVGIPAGAGVAAGLFLAGAAIAFFLPVEFAMCLAFYVAATLAYSFALKKIAIVDAIVLAGLYTLRLMVGHAVTGVAISVWLLAFSIFLFFSLALVKRFVEVGEMNSGTPPGALVAGRGYCAQDYWLIGALGISSGALSVLVLILYVNSPEVRILYQSPVLLMLLAPIFLYWIGRVWLLASREKLHEDPVLFALRDKTSYAIGLATAAVIFLSAGFK